MTLKYDVCDRLLRHCKNRPTGKYLGTLDTKLNEYHWTTFAEFKKRMDNFAKGLDVPQMRLCVCQNEKIANLIMDVHDLDNSPEFKSQESTRLQYLVLMQRNESTDRTLLEKRTEKAKIVLLDFDQVMFEGSKQKLMPYMLPSADDAYILTYTSGTTGNPKGVIQTMNMKMTIIRDYLCGPHNLNRLSKSDVYFSFLPYAHCFEQINMAIITYIGGRTGFIGSDPNQMMRDIAILKPTILSIVSRSFTKLYMTYYPVVKKKLGDNDKAVTAAVNDKIKQIERTGNCAAYSKMDPKDEAFSSVRDAFGGQLRMAYTGASMCLVETYKFFKAAFGIPVQTGYGCTEACGGVTLTMAEDTELGHVGALSMSTKVKLVSDPEIKSMPFASLGGEVRVKGLNVMKGYFKDPELTKEAFDENGWLKTGDIGMWDNKGRLCIIDRMKSIFKTSLGLYISPEKIEAILSTHVSSIIQIMVDGHIDKSKPYAIIFANYSEIYSMFVALSSFDSFVD
ncbi:Long-chain-fatty-acid--CoA ligase 6 [Cichlidogyrus casuarinus]|uniref:long-chain-fatty-acid--CoA ligase n=1 Tax=Cichlidogyrus casuarinus TaxID=1844966 RepID=A0ABD2PLG9_9PLAT